MKLHALFVAAIVAAGPAVAAGPYSGVPQAGDPMYSPTPMHAAHLELGFGLATNGDQTARQLGGVGRVAVPAFLGLRAEGEFFALVNSSDEAAATAYGFVSHLYKDAPTHALGAFAGVSVYQNTIAYIIGGEAKLYLGPLALTGVAGGMLPEGSGSGIYAFHGAADYYFTPDHKLSLKLNYFLPSDSSSENVWSVGGRIEKRFTGTEWGLFADTSYLTAGGDYVWSGRIGFRTFFDAPGTTLQQHEREVPFDVTSVTNFAR